MLAFVAVPRDNAPIATSTEALRRLLTDHLDVVEQVVRRVAHRRGLKDEDREELLGAIQLKLVENDYEALRRFEGRSQLSTYLASVVTRFVLDERNKRWGKWRPSKFAKRHGPVAVNLEMFMTRDGLSFDQAIAVLRTNFQITASEQELYQLSLGFPARAPRQFVDTEALEQLPNDSAADEDLERARRAALAKKVMDALDDSRATLHPQDQLLLRMCFEKGLPLSKVAVALRLDPKRAYRRREQLLSLLLRDLERQGITAADVHDIIGRHLEPPGQGESCEFA
jgi:RNA polymerase sigma factor (sigma-70 family)